MNERAPAKAGKDIIRINLEGDAATIMRWLVAIAQAEQGYALPASMNEPEPLLLTRAQAAKRLGRGEKHISALVREGKLHNYGSPSDWRISATELAALVASRP